MPVFDLQIDNMHCARCVRAVMLALRSVPYTHAEEVRVGAARVRTGASAEAVEAALNEAGFPARLERRSEG